jgi:diguanylate cyclase (GGDEF)-like protein
MRSFRERQSDLSIASAVFYFAGGLMSVLSITVFSDGARAVTPLRLIVGAASLALVVLFLVLGRSFDRRAALALLCTSAVLVLALTFFALTELRAMNIGLLFYTIIIYLVWFGPMWLARAFGYGWLVVYCVVVWLRFGGETPLYLATLALTSAVLGELVGAYKNRLEASTLTDPLCEVWNQRAFTTTLGDSVAAAHRSGRPLSLMFLDLDGFKQINDSRGHMEGDRTLRDFAEAIGQGVRSQDMFARLGGDEFALLLPGTGLAQAEAIGQRLHETVAGVAWSFGVAELRQGESVAEFTARADALMFEKKRQRGAGR